MSLIQLQFSDWWEDLKNSHNLLDQNFGLGLQPEQIPSSARGTNSINLNSLPSQDREIPLFNILKLLQQYEKNSSPTSPANKDDFQLVLDVQQFEPHEIDVKVVDDCLVITAKHEDKPDQHGWVSRQFVRKCKLPEDSNIEQLTSRLSSDGLLTIIAPKKEPLKEETERTIPIVRTGKPFVQQKKSKPKQGSEEKK